MAADGNAANVRGRKEKPFSLPEGWIVEKRARKGGSAAGQTYKCYYDTATGVKCYSMKEVLRHLNGENRRANRRETPQSSKSPAPEDGVDKNATPPYVHVQVECSPEGLPSGWIKEIRCSANGSAQRKDAYYIDPEGEYVFRTKKDAIHYLETGEIGRNVSKRKVKINNISPNIGSTPSNEPCLFVNPVSSCAKASITAQKSEQESASLNKNDSIKLEAEGITEISDDKSVDIADEKARAPMDNNIDTNLKTSPEPAGSIPANSRLTNPSPGIRFKRLACRSSFRKKKAKVESKVDEQHLQPTRSHPQTSADMDLSDDPSSPNACTASNRSQSGVDSENLKPEGCSV